MFDTESYRTVYLTTKWFHNEAKAGDPWKPLSEFSDLGLIKRSEELSSMSAW